MDWYKKFKLTFQTQYATLSEDAEKRKRLIQMFTWLKENKNTPNRNEESSIARLGSLVISGLNKGPSIARLGSLAISGLSHLYSSFWPKPDTKANLFKTVTYDDLCATDKLSTRCYFGQEKITITI